jgi:hypothetical protein
VNATRRKADRSQLDVAAMRQDAAELLDESAPLIRYDEVKKAEHRYRENLGRLIPELEVAAVRWPEGDVPAKVARAGIGEARRRLTEIEAVGLAGEVRRIRRLARSVVALCDHYDSLTGVRMCAVCDKPITADQKSVPYDLFVPPEGTETSEAHAGCMPARTRDRRG